MKKSIYDIEITDTNNKTTTLAQFKGQVLIIVNVASKCGLAQKNYEALSELIDDFYDEGLRILLFPCNNFLKQEPGEMKEIEEMVKNINKRFILFNKINVIEKGLMSYIGEHNGDQHELYKYLTENFYNGWMGKSIKWNFTKFIINRSGKIVGRFGPSDYLKSNNALLLKAMETRKTQSSNEIDENLENITSE
ncbi:hypothetical protein EDEG_02551 [Edhazardia aedis USNM 41457]|uniref:Glutathione peroxidase n=1 Tax=Edhazardia aedis (strain USNM 41457) TaxID=1003232 RepID=J9DP03_EDHAE|nr:hypothetical protein EDEG_02551 [Edhazardia aedis USNM 41457]|eukprot:EJW03072.1 hypothetical protein EDEG_02551 [Edhazardia aedis USNM 41457]